MANLALLLLLALLTVMPALADDPDYDVNIIFKTKGEKAGTKKQTTEDGEGASPSGEDGDSAEASSVPTRNRPRAKPAQVPVEGPEFVQKLPPELDPVVPQSKLTCDTAPNLKWTNDDWKKFFFQLIKESEVGPQSSPVAIQAMRSTLEAVCIIVQVNTAGHIRGRLYLPTGDPNNLFSRAVDVTPGWLGPWVWRPR
jgi:hypothetical protein